MPSKKSEVAHKSIDVYLVKIQKNYDTMSYDILFADKDEQYKHWIKVPFNLEKGAGIPPEVIAANIFENKYPGCIVHLLPQLTKKKPLKTWNWSVFGAIGPKNQDLAPIVWKSQDELEKEGPHKKTGEPNGFKIDDPTDVIML